MPTVGGGLGCPGRSFHLLISCLRAWNQSGEEMGGPKTRTRDALFPKHKACISITIYRISFRGKQLVQNQITIICSEYFSRKKDFHSNNLEQKNSNSGTRYFTHLEFPKDSPTPPPPECVLAARCVSSCLPKLRHFGENGASLELIAFL